MARFVACNGCGAWKNGDLSKLDREGRPELKETKITRGEADLRVWLCRTCQGKNFTFGPMLWRGKDIGQLVEEA